MMRMIRETIEALAKTEQHKHSTCANVISAVTLAVSTQTAIMEQVKMPATVTPVVYTGRPNLY